MENHMWRISGFGVERSVVRNTDVNTLQFSQYSHAAENGGRGIINIKRNWT